jgi:hypothetical protein
MAQLCSKSSFGFQPLAYVTLSHFFEKWLFLSPGGRQRSFCMRLEILTDALSNIQGSESLNMKAITVLPNIRNWSSKTQCHIPADSNLQASPTVLGPQVQLVSCFETAICRMSLVYKCIVHSYFQLLSTATILYHSITVQWRTKSIQLIFSVHRVSVIARQSTC